MDIRYGEAEWRIFFDIFPAALLVSRSLFVGYSFVYFKFIFTLSWSNVIPLGKASPFWHCRFFYEQGLSETKNNACVTNSKTRASRPEFLNRFAKNHFEENSTFTNLILLIFHGEKCFFFLRRFGNRHFIRLGVVLTIWSKKGSWRVGSNGYLLRMDSGLPIRVLKVHSCKLKKTIDKW